MNLKFDEMIQKNLTKDKENFNKLNEIINSKFKEIMNKIDEKIKEENSVIDGRIQEYIVESEKRMKNDILKIKNDA